MKRSIIAALLAVTAGTAAANNPFDFQRQFASEEYVHGYDASHIEFAPVARTAAVPSLNALMLASNVDSIAPNAHVGEIIEHGPSRISLYEVYRDTPEGTANQAYYARFPADADWDRIAREYRERQMNKGLAAELQGDDSRS